MIKSKMSRKKKVLIVSAIVLSTVIVLQGIRVVMYKSRISTLSVSELVISDVKNGEYKGYYDLDYVKKNVTVNVKNGKIADLIVKQKNETKQFNQAKEIVNRVIQLQSLKIDAVSGATASSKAILKATEIALKQGL